MTVIRNSEKWLVYQQKPEVDISISGGNGISWNYKGDLISWWRLYMKMKKFSFRRF